LPGCPFNMMSLSEELNAARGVKMSPAANVAAGHLVTKRRTNPRL
jgi:hypothetical protein